MRRVVVVSLVLELFALAACRPAPQREWPIWTGGGTYDSPDSYRSPTK